MLPKASPVDLNLNATLTLPPSASCIVNRKIWLPKVLYNCLPFFYLFAGVSAFAATLYVGAWYWVLPYYLLFSAACLHLCLYVFIRRLSNYRNDGQQP